MTPEQQAATSPTVERCTDPDEWDAFIERADGPPFALWGWGDAVETYGFDWWPLVAREDGRVVGALPLCHLPSYLFGSKLVSPPYAERGGVVLGVDADPTVRERLLDRAKRLADDLGVDFVSLRGTDHPDVAGFQHRRRFVTFSCPVANGVDSLREQVKDSRFRQIEQARDNPELTYRTAESRADLRRYFDLYLQSMRGHGTPPHAFDFFETLWDRFRDAGRLRLAVVERDGEIINGILELSCGSTVSQWGVVTDYEHRDRNGGSYLLWKSLTWAAENGYDAYEFGRTREGSGVYMFKKSFGGSKVWYDDAHYFPDGEVDLPHPETEAYEPIQRAWRRLPIPVTRVVGPRIRKRISL